MLAQLLIMVERENKIIVFVVRPLRLIAARELRRGNQMRHFAAAELKPDAHRSRIVLRMVIAEQQIRM